MIFDKPFQRWDNQVIGSLLSYTQVISMLKGALRCLFS